MSTPISAANAWTGFGLTLLDKLLALDVRSPKQKIAGAKSRRDDLILEIDRLGERVEEIMVWMAENGFNKRLDREKNRLERKIGRLWNRRRFWNARIASLLNA